MNLVCSKIPGALALFGVIFCGLLLFGCGPDRSEGSVATSNYVDSVIAVVDSKPRDSAVYYLNQAYARLRNPGPLDFYKKFQHLYYADKRSPNSPLIYADSMLLVLEGLEGDTSYFGPYVVALLMRAEAFAQEGLSTQAYKDYWRAAKLVSNSPSDAFSFEYYQKLGDFSKRFGKYREALSYYDKLLLPESDASVYTSFEKFSDQQSVLIVIGSVYSEFGKPDSALTCYQRALALNTDYKGVEPDKGFFKEVSRGYIVYAMSEIEYTAKHLELAGEHLRESIRILNREGYGILTAQEALYRLGQVYFDMGLVSESDSMATCLRVSLDELPCDKHELEWHFLRSKLAFRNGDYRNAFLHLKMHVDLGGTLDRKSEKAPVDLTKEFTRIEQEDEISELKVQRRQNLVYLVMSVCIALLALVIAFQLWTNSRRKKKMTDHLQTLMTAMEDIIFELDGNQVFKGVWVNDEGLLFLPKSEFIGRSVHQVFGSQSEVFCAPINQVLEHGGTTETEYQHVDPNVKKWYKAKTTLIAKFSDAQKSKVVISIQDITAKKNQELALEEVRRKLEQSISEKDRIMQILIHDLRSPLSGIHSLTSMIVQRNKLEGAEKEMIDVVCDTSLFLFKMVSDLVDLTLPNENSVLDKESVDFSEIIRQTSLVLQFKAQEKFQTLSLQVKDRLMGKVDAQKIKRMLFNLITNAIKFSPDYSTIYIRAERKGENVRLSVEDHGIGIPEDLQSLVFDVFTKAKRFGTNKEQPFGIGLSICKQIVEAHRGKIWFESKPGVGTIFYVELPGDISGN